MKQPDKNKATTLAEWLEIATRGLAAPSKERITREIEAHYAEALEAHLGCGKSESEGRTAALTDLGDVRQAARRFRRLYLKESEIKTLEQNDKASKSVKLLGVSHVLFCGFVMNHGRTFQNSWMTTGLAFLILVALPTSAFLLARRRTGHPRGWLYTLIRCCNVPGLGIVFFSIISQRRIVSLPALSVDFWLDWILVLVFVTRLFFALRLAKKLHGLQKDPKEIPSHPAAFN